MLIDGDLLTGTDTNKVSSSRETMPALCGDRRCMKSLWIVKVWASRWGDQVV